MVAALFATLGLLAASATALPCISFDSQWNLYAFGVQGQHNWALGKADDWSEASGAKVTSLDSTNAPPMNGNNTQCFLAQFYNAIYVLDGDSSNPNAVHIFNPNSKTWSIQSISVPEHFDITSAGVILDHDTNVFFGLSGDNLYQLDMSNQVAAKSDPLKWEEVNKPNFKTGGYNPVMAIADNHVFFLNVPGNAAGETNIFVIHFAYFQPDVQAFKPKSGSAFPATGGETASIWQAPGSSPSPQKSFAFFPNDGSATYIVNVLVGISIASPIFKLFQTVLHLGLQSNTTSTIPFPPATPSSGYSAYAGSLDTLVQLTPSGELYYRAISSSSTKASKSTKSSRQSSSSGGWSKINNSLWSEPSASSQIATATAKGGSNSTPQPTASASATASGSSTNAAVEKGVDLWAVLCAPLLGGILAMIMAY
ncbi:hypothetical protein FRC04_010459 [Tulasnella sp. 424]|nr:hypothetical protein FRC04_010459 [Tulasnella sp. 424]KAG8978610.1 hypothetical protein FRC05_009882 [Tulasnella sp. 425]